MIVNRSGIQDLKIENTHEIVYADGRSKEITTPIIQEHFLEVFLEEQSAFRIICTPTNLEELVLGRLSSEGILKNMEELDILDICENGNRARVFMKEKKKLQKSMQAEPTCCTGNETLLEVVNPQFESRKEKVPYQNETIFLLADSFSKGSMIHKSTKGTHCCYLAYKGEVVFAVEDIGRHNALDKAIGYAVKNEYDRKQCIFFTTGRVPTDMVKKVIQGGFPTLVSKAVPTNEAVALAKEHQINLICKAWPDSFEVFA